MAKNPVIFVVEAGAALTSAFVIKDAFTKGPEVFFGIDAYRVEVGGFDVDRDVVFKEAELLEAFGLFEGAGGQGGEALERGFAVGV